MHPTGEPWTEITVAAFPTACDDANAWMSFRALMPYAKTTTDARGAFRLGGLHASCTYEIVCIPDPARSHCHVREPSIPAGTDDLVIVVDEARIRGGVLIVEAVRGPLREPVDSVSFGTMYELKPGEDWGGHGRRASLVDGVFRIEGLVIGNEYFVDARTRDAAALTIGPWIASPEEHRVELAFGFDGGAKVFLRYEDDGHAMNWSASLVAIGDGPHRPVELPPRGPEAAVRIQPVPAGRYHLSARRGIEVVGPFTIEIHAGRTTELTIEVPRD